MLARPVPSGCSAAAAARRGASPPRCTCCRRELTEQASRPPQYPCRATAAAFTAGGGVLPFMHLVTLLVKNRLESKAAVETRGEAACRLGASILWGASPHCGLLAAGSLFPASRWLVASPIPCRGPRCPPLLPAGRARPGVSPGRWKKLPVLLHGQVRLSPALPTCVVFSAGNKQRCNASDGEPCVHGGGGRPPHPTGKRSLHPVQLHPTHQTSTSTPFHALHPA